MFLSELSEGIELDEDEDIEFLGNKSCRRNNDCRSYEFCNDNGKCVEDDTGRRCKQGAFCLFLCSSMMYMHLCCSSLPLLTGRWDDDCGRDQRCRDRRCKRDTRKMERCEKRSDCGAHMLCKDGYCKRRDFDDIMEELAEVN